MITGETKINRWTQGLAPITGALLKVSTDVVALPARQTLRAAGLRPAAWV